MDFSTQVKKIRLENKLTQEQFAQTLHVSRQTISSWENNRNLPDLEMVVQIASHFHLSLDQLILGDDAMTNKLIRDSSETKRARNTLISLLIGSLLLIIGTLCIVIKGLSVEYIDAQGILHENFFLLPIGFLFLTSGLLTFLVLSIYAFRNKRKK